MRDLVKEEKCHFLIQLTLDSETKIKNVCRLVKVRLMWTFITKFKGNSKAQLCMFISLKSGRKFTISIHLIYQEIIFFKAWLWYILFLEFKCLLLFRLEHHCLIPKTNFTFLYSPPWQQKIFSSTIAAIGRQLKQSVNVFQSLMLYRRLPTKHSDRLLYM